MEAKLLKNGKPIPAKDIEISVQEKIVKFTIKKPAREDAGRFTIKMFNGAGVSSKDVNLNMQDKPSPPTNIEVHFTLKAQNVL